MPAKSAAAIQRAVAARRRPTTTRRDATRREQPLVNCVVCGADLMPSACLDSPGCKMRQHVIIVRCERRFMCAVCECAAELTRNQTEQIHNAKNFFMLLLLLHCHSHYYLTQQYRYTVESITCSFHSQCEHMLRLCRRRKCIRNSPSFRRHKFPARCI